MDPQSANLELALRGAVAKVAPAVRPGGDARIGSDENKNERPLAKAQRLARAQVPLEDAYALVQLEGDEARILGKLFDPTLLLNYGLKSDQYFVWLGDESRQPLLGGAGKDVVMETNARTRSPQTAATGPVDTAECEWVVKHNDGRVVIKSIAKTKEICTYVSAKDRETWASIRAALWKGWLCVDAQRIAAEHHETALPWTCFSWCIEGHQDHIRLRTPQNKYLLLSAGKVSLGDLCDDAELELTSHPVYIGLVLRRANTQYAIAVEPETEYDLRCFVADESSKLTLLALEKPQELKSPVP